MYKSRKQLWMKMKFWFFLLGRKIINKKLLIWRTTPYLSIHIFAVMLVFLWQKRNANSFPLVFFFFYSIYFFDKCQALQEEKRKTSHAMKEKKEERTKKIRKNDE